jgi:adenosylmethionine-8-amino-7-oxononanoate aminotransferase
LGHAFYASDGASAVEIALKMSHHFWQLNGKHEKKKFVCLENGYHGETLGALAVTDVAIFREAYGSLLQDVFTVTSPDSRNTKAGENAEQAAEYAAKELEQLLQKEHEHIAAIIIEPLVQCAGQMAMHSPEYLRLARDLCNRYEVHLIADEIAVGCGRSGKFFACEHAGIWPDFLTLSKGISGGYLPLSLCLTTDAIYRAFYSDQTRQGFLHSHSYTGNPLACAISMESIDVIEKECIPNVEIVQHTLNYKLSKLENKQIDCVRGMGLFYGIQFNSMYNLEALRLRMLDAGYITCTSRNNTISFTNFNLDK